MKILYYNWLPFDAKRTVGGGVQIYQKNIIDYLVRTKQYVKDEVYFLSSGFKYNPLRNKAYIRKSKNIYGRKIKSYEIINSPILSPQCFVAANINNYSDNVEIIEIFKQFVTKCGGFDVIHINNFEGITPACMKIKDLFPDTKIVFSVHNYATICPSVQLFKDFELKICQNCNQGNDCIRCLAGMRTPKSVYKERCYSFFDMFRIPHFVSKFLMRIFAFRMKSIFIDKNISSKDDFYRFRQTNIEYINKYCDVVLAVSQRVADICTKYGINTDIVKVSYIGTKFAEIATYKNNKPIPKNDLTIAYLGYARNDKGYFFLLDALSSLPIDVAKKINIVIAAKNATHTEKISNLKSVRVYDGYTPNNLSEILKDVDLGVVPVIWEDNLPQIAIEMSACGVPVLASSFGGASELCNSEIFKFDGGNIESFHNKIKQFAENPKLLLDYFTNAKQLTTMSTHIQELYRYYQGKK